MKAATPTETPTIPSADEIERLRAAVVAAVADENASISRRAEADRALQAAENTVRTAERDARRAAKDSADYRSAMRVRLSDYRELEAIPGGVDSPRLVGNIAVGFAVVFKSCRQPNRFVLLPSELPRFAGLARGLYAKIGGLPKVHDDPGMAALRSMVEAGRRCGMDGDALMDALTEAGVEWQASRAEVDRTTPRQTAPPPRLMWPNGRDVVLRAASEKAYATSVSAQNRKILASVAQAWKDALAERTDALRKIVATMKASKVAA